MNDGRSARLRRSLNPLRLNIRVAFRDVAAYPQAVDRMIPENDRSHWPAKRCGSFDEMRAYRIRQWQEAGCEARMNAAWELVADYWVGSKGKDPDELRLQRSVAHLRRRGG